MGHDCVFGRTVRGSRSSQRYRGNLDSRASPARPRPGQHCLGNDCNPMDFGPVLGFAQQHSFRSHGYSDRLGNAGNWNGCIPAVVGNVAWSLPGRKRNAHRSFGQRRAVRDQR